jgi:UDP-GlcNAc:undecaprenyl-phosphate GlcNAc-1-phosphate transferase
MIYFFLFNLFIYLFFDKIKNIYNVYDQPDFIRKIHKKKIPLFGGFYLILNLTLIFIFHLINDTALAKLLLIFNNQKEALIFFFISCLIFVCGYFDDKFGITPFKKLFSISFIIASFLLLDENSLIKNLQFAFYSENVELKKFSFLFTFLCMIILINAINMFDGVNLQLGLYSFFIFLVFYIKSNNIFFIVLIIFLIFFLFLNLANKTFLGDSGSLLLGFIFSYFLINFYNRDYLEVEGVILLTFLPILEFLRIFFHRLLKGNNPFIADNNHLHHFLLKKFKLIFVIFILFLFFAAPYILFILLQISFIYIFISFIFCYFLIIFLLIKKII